MIYRVQIINPDERIELSEEKKEARIEKTTDLSKPDMEEWIGATLALISNRPSLYYEILIPLGKGSQRFFHPEVEPLVDRHDGAVEDVP